MAVEIIDRPHTTERSFSSERRMQAIQAFNSTYAEFGADVAPLYIQPNLFEGEREFLSDFISLTTDLVRVAGASRLLTPMTSFTSFVEFNNREGDGIIAREEGINVRPALSYLGNRMIRAQLLMGETEIGSEEHKTAEADFNSCKNRWEILYECSTPYEKRYPSSRPTHFSRTSHEAKIRSEEALRKSGQPQDWLLGEEDLEIHRREFNPPATDRYILGLVDPSVPGLPELTPPLPTLRIDTVIDPAENGTIERDRFHVIWINPFQGLSWPSFSFPRPDFSTWVEKVRNFPKTEENHRGRRRLLPRPNRWWLIPLIGLSFTLCNIPGQGPNPEPEKPPVTGTDPGHKVPDVLTNPIPKTRIVEEPDGEPFGPNLIQEIPVVETPKGKLGYIAVIPTYYQEIKNDFPVNSVKGYAEYDMTIGVTPELSWREYSQDNNRIEPGDPYFLKKVAEVYERYPDLMAEAIKSYQLLTALVNEGNTQGEVNGDSVENTIMYPVRAEVLKYVRESVDRNSGKGQKIIDQLREYLEAEVKVKEALR
ncbi:hypothetical protein HY384_02400 [Candidatus Daviesbacteria bacterium]|nr:hypothetical protein [Candidatus Daviesbacteria bacterium]